MLEMCKKLTPPHPFSNQTIFQIWLIKVICGSQTGFGVYAFKDIDMAVQPPQPPSPNIPKASWRAELASLNSRKKSSRYLSGKMFCNCIAKV